MSENSSNGEKDFNSGRARLETGTKACFSANNSIIEISFDDSEKCVVQIASGETKHKIFIEKSEDEEFLKKIIFLGRKPEVRSESY